MNLLAAALALAATISLAQVPGTESRVASDPGRGVPGQPKPLADPFEARESRSPKPASQPNAFFYREQPAQGALRTYLRYDANAPGQHPDLALTLSPLGRESDNLGATLAPVDPALRKQLNLGDSTGVILTSIVPGGPAERVKLQVNDILIGLLVPDSSTTYLFEKPGDFSKHLKAVGERPIQIQLVRAGERMNIPIKPRFRVTLAPVDDESPRYFIGVQAAPVDDALRAHLKLGDDGLVVTEVVADSPAQKARVEVGDILIQLGDTPLADVETLLNTVQDTGGKETKLALVRAGKRTSVNVTPAPRPASDETESTDVVFGLDHQLYTTNVPRRPHTAVWTAQGVKYVDRMAPGIQPGGPASQPAIVQFTPDGQTLAGPADARIDALTQQVEELRKAVEDLKNAVEKR